MKRTYPPFPEDPDALVRVQQILSVLPVGRTTLFFMIKRGDFPPPLKLGRTCLWRASEVKKILQNLGREDDALARF